MKQETELLCWHVHIVISIKIHMTGINNFTGILIDSSVHRQNGYAGMSVLGINRESSSTGMPKRSMKIELERSCDMACL